MTYNTKAEFMAALQREALRCSLRFEDMAEDFERHFSEGEKKVNLKARYAQSSAIPLR